jgi:hypothetical protein
VRGDGIRPEADAPPGVVLGQSIIDRALDAGVHVAGARARVEDTVVVDTLGCDGAFGDGIAVHGDVVADASVELERVRVDSSRRAGVASFGADVQARALSIDGCGDEPVAAMARGGRDPALDLSSARCSCGGSVRACAAVTESFEPSLVAGNGCDEHRGGVCYRACFDDYVLRLGVMNRNRMVSQGGAVPHLALWALDDLTVAGARADQDGCVEWGGLPPRSELVMALARDRDQEGRG